MLKRTEEDQLTMMIVESSGTLGGEKWVFARRLWSSSSRICGSRSSNEEGCELSAGFSFRTAFAEHRDLINSHWSNSLDKRAFLTGRANDYAFSWGLKDQNDSDHVYATAVTTGAG